MSRAASQHITVIKPSRGFASLDLYGLWTHRELLYFLTWRDVRIRYKQTAIGIAWALLQPILTTLIFTAIFSTFARFDTGGVPYPLFALSGLMLWLYVHSSVTLAAGSFVSNANLVTKVYFPRIIVPLAAVISGLFDLVFSALVFVVLMIWYGVVPSAGSLLAIAFVAAALLLAASLGLLFSALNVKFRDVKFALPFLLQVWMIASPIFYPASMISPRWRLAFAVNPLTGILEGFRSAIFGLPFEWPLIAVSLASLAVIAGVALAVFRWMEDDFADIV
ncbi:MAG: ABC transporter permease [Pyrinomonadaceae bacterium]